MSGRLPAWYSDSIEFYNSDNLKLPEAVLQISDALNLQKEDNQFVISDWRRLFLVPTPIRINVQTQPSMAVVSYSFSLINPLFISTITAVMAFAFGINNFKVLTIILLAVAVIAFFLIISIQNSYIRKSIYEAICLPEFEGEAQVLHNQMLWMNDLDRCPACGEPRDNDSAICKNCGIKLPLTNKTKQVNDNFTPLK